jgi:hypothetical protein
MPLLRFSVFIFLLLIFTGPLTGQVKRSRAEAIPGIVTSNTIGFGNIWTRSYVQFISRSNDDMVLEPYGAIGLGLSQYMSISAGAVPFEGGLKQVVGKSDAHLKATLPFNDKLRFIGLGVQGDLVLSTEQDTSSKGQDTSRPAFLPKLGMTVALDLDFIKQIKIFPFKFYLNWSLFDNDRLLAEYHQHSIRGGVEYKGPRHSIFVGVRYGLYKRISRVKEENENAKYDQNVLAVTPGIRYRIWNRFSIVGSGLINVYSRLRRNTEVFYEKFAVRLGLEFPIFFRETNTEAIRAIIFLERRKMAGKELVKQQEEKEEDEISTIFTEELTGEENEELLKMLKEGDVKSEREKKRKEKRKKINEELRKIEKMIE